MLIQYTFRASKENKNTWNKWEIRSNFFAAWRRFISAATVLISSHIDFFQWLYQVQPQTAPWSTVLVSYSAWITCFQIFIKSINAMELFKKYIQRSYSDWYRLFHTSHEDYLLSTIQTKDMKINRICAECNRIFKKIISLVYFVVGGVGCFVVIAVICRDSNDLSSKSGCLL